MAAIEFSTYYHRQHVSSTVTFPLQCLWQHLSAHLELSVMTECDENDSWICLPGYNAGVEGTHFHVKFSLDCSE